MQNISKAVCLKFKDARRNLGLTQIELAQEIGCHQAALSMFENGNTTKLSGEYVSKIAARLKIDLKEILEKGMDDAVEAEPYSPKFAVSGFCPDPDCPSNVPYSVGSRTLIRVSLMKGRYCAHCGEVVVTRCPSCGAVPNEGACCIACGKPYIPQ